MEGANLLGAIIVDSTLENTNFTNANLKGAEIINTSSADEFEFSILSHTIMPDGNIYDADCNPKTSKDILLDDYKAGIRDFTNNFAYPYPKLDILENVDLSCVELPEIKLWNIVCQNTILSYANLKYSDLVEMYFKNANLEGINLEDSILSGSFFIATNLKKANLKRVRFQVGGCRANFTDTDLSQSDLSNANLSGIILINANFTGANLTNANLSKTDLTRANFTEAELTGVNLNEAIYCSRTIFPPDVDLSQAIAIISGVNLSGYHRNFLSGRDLRNLDLS